ncbi:hypothetical protein [Streptomyces fradiae]|uniref:hypothetical protein n=1 Tax=Streptomyces fradiae TaxID=1906 RepID=UPI00366717BB
MKTPIWCRSQSSEVGDARREVIDQLLEVNALYRLRATQGILGLRKKYGDQRLEAACTKATAVGDPSYRTIKGILIAGTETDPEPETDDAGAAAFLHGPEGLFAASSPRIRLSQVRSARPPTNSARTRLSVSIGRLNIPMLRSLPDVSDRPTMTPHDCRLSNRVGNYVTVHSMIGQLYHRLQHGERFD